jgi:Ca2+-binding RTX toxin-like protein
MVAACTALAAAAPAVASTVSLTYQPSSPRNDSSYAFNLFGSAGPNDVTITARRDLLRVVDRSEPVEARDLCNSVAAREAECALTRPVDVLLVRPELGAGDDAIQVEGDLNAVAPRLYTSVRVDGGTGDDVLQGSAGPGFPVFFEGREGDDTFLGGPSNEAMTGGAGLDAFRGGAGIDRYEFAHGAFEGANDIDGGDGPDDSVEYWPWDSRPITIDLAAGSDSLGNRVAGFEHARTHGFRSAAIAGNEADNRLLGTPGRDTLSGRGGNDELLGFVGADLLDGGEGDDFLDAYDDYRDDARCGPGEDRLRPGLLTLVGADCEWLIATDYSPPVRRQPVLVSPNGYARFEVPCAPRARRAKVCRLRAALGTPSERRRTRRTGWARRGSVARASVPLPPGARRAIASGGAPVVGVRVAMDSGQRRSSVRWEFRLGYRTPVR